MFTFLLDSNFEVFQHQTSMDDPKVENYQKQTHHLFSQPDVLGNCQLADVSELERLIALQEKYPGIEKELALIKESIKNLLQKITPETDAIADPLLNHREKIISIQEEINSTSEQAMLIDTLPYNRFTNHIEKRKEKILIIEDEYESRYFIRNILGEKYETDESANGSDGYAKALELMPDLIISDIVMPGMNGIELCKKIKTDVKTSHIPIVLLTARSAAEQKLQGFEAGADAYINKPFNMMELMLRVRNLLETLNNQRKKYAHDIFQTPRQATTNCTDEKFLHKVIQHVEDNIDDPHLDISALAGELNMSSSNLYRKIKSITGMSSIDFVINHKMKYAAHLLLSANHSVKEVAYMTGFTDPRYFSTRFKKYFQYTPTEYVEVMMHK